MKPTLNQVAAEIRAKLPGLLADSCVNSEQVIANLIKPLLEPDGPQRMSRQMHCIPIGDLEIHSAQAICWCHPTNTEPLIWVHHAKDGRERFERQGLARSPGWINIAEFVPTT